MRYFSDILPFSTDLSVATDDFPGSALTRLVDHQFVHAMYIDDRFETYVVYFAGGTGPSSPFIQRPIGKLAWNWGGLVVFDPDRHRVRFSNATPGARVGQPTNSMVAMQSNVVNNSDVPCPGEGALSTNHIDSSRFFVRQHYLDLLRRDPRGDAAHQPDLEGWAHWTADISQCVFDEGCIRAYRINTGLAFMFCAEFINIASQLDPSMANPPGSPGFNPAVYNRAFVRWCYKTYLQREPDPEGWDHWTNDLNSDGNYGHIIDAFQVCDEYRNRPGFH